MKRWNVQVTNIPTRLSKERFEKYLGNLEKLNFDKTKKRRAKRKKI